MLEGGDELARAHIEKVIINQYERLQGQKSEAGAKALAVAVKGGAERCQLCHKTSQDTPLKFSGEGYSCWKRGHSAEECR